MGGQGKAPATKTTRHPKEPDNGVANCIFRLDLLQCGDNLTKHALLEGNEEYER